ncbi:MAG: metallophosphoesterase [Candidatus Heimdallarchaeota archaeon]|nr:MAG: metallophosphoesterase [Candidatus Heimdallarchaeota archaeon]
MDHNTGLETINGRLKMDFPSAIKTLQFYLDDQKFLQKILSLEDLKYISTPAISLLLTQEGEVFHLPEDRLFKKGIFFLDDDWIDPKKLSKDRFSKSNVIKSSIDLFENIINHKMIRSGYWELFNTLGEIKLIDSILLLKRNNNSVNIYDLIIIKGPMNEAVTVLPDFLSSTNLLFEYIYSSTPHSRPPKLEQFLSYRNLKETAKLNWNMKQISTYMGSIWCERTSSNLFSRLMLLFESAVLLAEKNQEFNRLLQVNPDNHLKVGIPSNFIIGICGGYARGEYSKNSDLDMLLIHEGNNKQFLQVGETLDNVLRYVPNLELCKMENLKNLNFHENSISNILRAFLKGDESYLEKNQRIELDKMLRSIEQLRKTPLSPEERKDGISKYCWSIYKSIIDMIPIYEKPIGKGDYLRRSITQAAKKSFHELIPILLRVTDFFDNETDKLGEYLRVCAPYTWDSIFKKFSALTALQDIGTIFAVLTETTFTSSTIDRFKVAMERNIITEEQSNKLIQGYTILSQLKYKLTNELPIDALELMNNDLRSTMKEVYGNILENLEPEESEERHEPIAYPLLVFSDLHWGLNNKLAKKCLVEIKKIGIKNQVRSIIIAGDVLNIDRVNELEETDKEGVSLLNELSQIQNSLGNQRIHIIAGNHDPESFYDKFRDKLKRELDIHFLGNHYTDENIWIEHGDLGFWKDFRPPMDQHISKFRSLKRLKNLKIVVGHNHRIYEEKESDFYANGTIGKSFSSILVTSEAIKLIKTPIEYSFDFDKISKDLSEIRNADNSINDYIQDNFDVVEWDQFTTDLVSPNAQKKTWIVTETGVPTGIIPFNRAQKINKLDNIRVYEVAFPIHYTFTLNQTLKEAWGVFSVTGESILPVMNQENQIVGILSIFSVPKPEKEHSETQLVTIDDKMEKVGDFLTQKLFEKQKKMKKI